MVQLNFDYLEIETLTDPSPREIRQIGAIAENAFQRFGHYRDFIASLVSKQGVITGLLVDRSEDDRIVGFLLLGLFPEDGKFIADVLAIALLRMYRGVGLGKDLMEWAFALLNNISLRKRISEVRLTVAPDNERAVRLFTRYGFSFDRESDLGTYPSGVKAVYMKRTLPPEPLLHDEK